MNPEPSGLSAALSRAWRAIVKAFSSTPDARESPQYGADTTLFGAVSEQPRNRRGPEGAKNEFWVPTESTDFAEFDAERDSERRR